MSADHLTLLRTVVKAKMAYWDALRELEIALTGSEFSDRANDAVIDDIDMLAAGLEHVETVDERVTDEHLEDITKLAKLP